MDEVVVKVVLQVFFKGMNEDLHVVQGIQNIYLCARCLLQRLSWIS